MRQVPCYLLIGNGRLARHFQHYFALLHLPFRTWHRQESLEKLQQKLQSTTHILLLISDQAINEFIMQHLMKTNALRIHFSGSLVTDLAYGIHPLNTFSHQLYSLDRYQALHFILDHDAPEFDKLLPGLSNQYHRLHKSLKPKYHALCVLSGNFTSMLWQKLFSSLEHEFDLPIDVAHPYLLQITQNLLNEAQLALTGPLVRGDHRTIENNLNALKSDPFHDVYKSFVICFERLKEEGLV